MRGHQKPAVDNKYKKMRYVTIILFLISSTSLSFAIVDPTCKCGDWDYNNLDEVIAKYDSVIKLYPDSSELYFKIKY